MGAIREATKEEAVDVNLPHNDNYVFFCWHEDGKEVYFSGTRRGNAMEIHTATKNGLRCFRNAVNDFVKTIFCIYSWCDAIIGFIQKRSILKVAIDCGFKPLSKIRFHSGVETLVEMKKWVA